ncbi:MAG: hypothetical protein ACTS6H_01605 [Candidatus Hodgkinia cicadicola]
MKWSNGRILPHRGANSFTSEASDDRTPLTFEQTADFGPSVRNRTTFGRSAFSLLRAVCLRGKMEHEERITSERDYHCAKEGRKPKPNEMASAVPPFELASGLRRPEGAKRV